MSDTEHRTLITRRPVFLWGLVLALLAFGTWHVLYSSTIEHIIVRSDGAHVPLERVRKRLEKFEGRNFWSLDLHAVQRQAEGHPWVDHVEVQRIWPSTLIVRVWEHQVAARWGEDGLLSRRGIVFRPEPETLKAFQDYVLIEGRDELSEQLLETVRWLRRQAKPLQWSLTRLQRLPDGTLKTWWKPRNRVLLMDETRYRKQFHRLKAAWPKLYKSLRLEAKIFDLRYSNGFAVRN